MRYCNREDGYIMRFNTDNYYAIANEKHISDDAVRESTGLSEGALNRILENRAIECQTLELIADAIGCPAADLSLPDATMCNENCIEWCRGQEQATLTLTQRKTITRVEKLAVSRPEECHIVGRNLDGSIVAHIPVSWIRINPNLQLTEEQREERAVAMRKNIHNNDTDRSDLG